MKRGRKKKWQTKTGGCEKRGEGVLSTNKHEKQGDSGVIGGGLWKKSRRNREKQTKEKGNGAEVLSLKKVNITGNPGGKPDEVEGHHQAKVNGLKGGNGKRGEKSGSNPKEKKRGQRRKGKKRKHMRRMLCRWY